MDISVNDVVSILSGGDKIIMTSSGGSTEYNKATKIAFGDLVVKSLDFDWDNNAWVIRLKEEPVKG